jgi:GINS complex subunit 4
MNMVVEPNLDAPVFCKALSTIGHVQIGPDEVLFENDGSFFCHYRDIEHLLKEDKVKLV